LKYVCGENWENAMGMQRRETGGNWRLNKIQGLNIVGKSIKIIDSHL